MKELTLLKNNMSKKDNKILGMILKGYPRISETFISNEIRLLEKRGVKIHIISMRKPRENFTHKSVKEIKADVSYLPSELDDCMEKLFGTTDMEAWLKDPRYNVDHEYKQRADIIQERYSANKTDATLKHLLQAEYIIEKILPDSNITHIHAHFAHSPTSVARNVSLLSGLPFSFTAHAKDIYTQASEKIADKIGSAEFAVTCTGYNCKYLQNISPEGKPIHKVYHGIDLSLFSSNRTTEAKSPYNILTVARFTTKKGIPTILKALKELDSRGIDFNYRIVGEGDERKKTLEMVTELGISHRVEWLGTRPHEEVLEEYKKADLFTLGCEIAPNGDRDGIPNVLAESMAMSVPIVTTDISGIPELIENGKSGLLVSPKDHIAMADAMEKMLTDNKFRSLVIPAALKRVHKVFDNSYWIEKLFEVYESHGIKAC